jgi:ubiquinone/menaquinone biosynthesis C-methylase UbiE
LDLGCGGTTLTQELARLVGSQGKVLGIDKDTENITHARQEAKVLGLSQLHYHVADIVQWEGESSQYDFAFSRFLLTHLPDPLELLRQVYLSLKPGGRMLLEDIDFTGHFCYPACDAFDRYVALYTATVQHTGADPNIGPSLPSLLQDAGFRHIQCTLVQPVFQRGEGKQISSLTLEFIAESLIHNQLASREAITTYLAELRAFEQDETTLVSLPRIFQVWAVK